MPQRVNISLTMCSVRGVGGCVVGVQASAEVGTVSTHRRLVGSSRDRAVLPTMVMWYGQAAFSEGLSFQCEVIFKNNNLFFSD